MSNIVDLDLLGDRERAELAASLSGPADRAAATAMPNVRRVSVMGVDLDVDMRRVTDYRTLSLIAKMEGGDSFAAVQLFDFILGPERDRCVEELSDSDGFCDAERFSAFCAGVIKAVGAKN